jgi:hypothetical protein
MLPVPTQGPSFAGGFSPSSHQVMKVFTVTLIDDGMEHGNGRGGRLLQSAQHRRTMIYDRNARTVTSAIPPTIDLRI